MNQQQRFRKGNCIFCGAKINILQQYNTQLSEYVDVSIPACRNARCLKRQKKVKRGVLTIDNKTRI